MAVRLFVDPGIRACGTALFRDERLIAAGYPEGSKPEFTPQNDPGRRAWIGRSMAEAIRLWSASSVRGVAPAVDVLVIEMPEVLKRGHQKENKRGTNPNDLMHLAAVVGAICASCPSFDVFAYLPGEWKGTMRKDIMHTRARALLAPEELEVLPNLPDSKLHNVMDAVSMGLVYMRRLRAAL